MRSKHHFALLALAAPILFGSDSSGATLDFESVPIHSRFGDASGNEFSDVVLVQDGITMSVEPFFSGDFQAFFRAEVGHGQEFFPTTPLGLINISVRFGFDDVGFEVNQASIEYVEFGGVTNFTVNDLPVRQFAAITDLPSDIAPSVEAAVEGGLITLTGSIDSFQIGGAELVIDNIVAVPEPGTLILVGLGACFVGGLRHKRRTIIFSRRK